MSTTATTAMLTIKLVVIGPSGVGKTSIRGQYISGRFSSGYRATIGADFIAKTLPHPTNTEKTVTLQIWDTAGQERFSSLSTAFFRGADAVILMFDVNRVETLDAMKKWWAEYCVGVPLVEEDMLEHPCFVVGNKIDLTKGEGYGDEERISPERIQEFLSGLMPSRDLPSPSIATSNSPPNSSSPIQVQTRTLSSSIDIHPKPSSPRNNITQSSPGHARSYPKFLNNANKFDTISSLNTINSVYLTPSSSLFTTAFHTARSSPEPPPSASTSSFPGLTTSASTPVLRITPTVVGRQSRLRTVSTGSTSSGSAVTMTPSLFAREQQENTLGQSNGTNDTALTTPEEDILDLPDADGDAGADTSTLTRFTGGGPPPLPERGPSLHFTSAKTGEGVKELFEHIARRVVQKMEYEEYFESRRMHYRDASGAETIRLGMSTDSRVHLRASLGKIRKGCCV